jgi:hypothetical protein
MGQCIRPWPSILFGAKAPPGAEQFSVLQRTPTSSPALEGFMYDTATFAWLWGDPEDMSDVTVRLLVVPPGPHMEQAGDQNGKGDG